VWRHTRQQAGAAGHGGVQEEVGTAAAQTGEGGGVSGWWGVKGVAQGTEALECFEDTLNRQP